MAFYSDLLEKATDYLGYDASEEVPNYENGEPFFKDPKHEKLRLSVGGKVGQVASGKKFEFCQTHRKKSHMDYDEDKMVEESTDRTTFVCDYGDGLVGQQNWTRNAATMELEGELLDKEGLKVAGGADFQNKFGVHQKVGAKFAVESPDMGGVTAFMNFGAERKFFPKISGATSTEDEISGDINLTIQGDTHIGASVEKEGGDIKKLNVQAVYQGFDKVVGWVRADTMNKWVSSGCSVKESEQFSHSHELVYGYGNKSKTQGVKDSPVWLRLGGIYKMSDSSTLVSSYLFAKHMEKHSQITHKVNDNVKLGVHYHYDQRHQGAKDRSAHDFGYSLHYEL